MFKLKKEDWEAGKKSAEETLRQSEMMRVQALSLLAQANRELKKYSFKEKVKEKVKGIKDALVLPG